MGKAHKFPGHSCHKIRTAASPPSIIKHWLPVSQIMALALPQCRRQRPSFVLTVAEEAASSSPSRQWARSLVEPSWLGTSSFLCFNVIQCCQYRVFCKVSLMTRADRFRRMILTHIIHTFQILVLAATRVSGTWLTCDKGLLCR